VQHAIAVIAIGRNEGNRLERCLDSARSSAQLVIYVDSGSTDGSVALARSMGAEVVELDPARPFTAARARNAGLARVLALRPAIEHVQFIDGDCELRKGWLQTAHEHLHDHPETAAVFGRRRERHPERSVYNRLCDLEWRVPPGAAKSFGGDVMVRASALQGVGGYRDDLIAGEEPELCVRLRRLGWQIHALEGEMTWHDADMRRFRQWWLRNKRCGYAYATGA
jgi:glycosyltransferase involved in cell wall biosynthesis